MKQRRGEAKAGQEEGTRWGLGSQGEDLRFDETRKEVTQKSLHQAGSGCIEQQGKHSLQGRDHLRLPGSSNQASVRAKIEGVGTASTQKTDQERMNLSCPLTG